MFALLDQFSIKVEKRHHLRLIFTFNLSSGPRYQCWKCCWRDDANVCRALMLARQFRRIELSQKIPARPNFKWIFFLYKFEKESNKRNFFLNQVFNAKVREGSRYQIGWFFGKIPDGLWPPPHFWKIIVYIIFYNGYGRIYARRHRPDSIS